MSNEVKKDNVIEMPVGPKTFSSVDDIIAAGATNVEYRYIKGFTDEQRFRIGSVSAGEIMIWSEANEGEAKRTAGLRLITKSLVDDDGRRYADHSSNIEKFKQFRHKEADRIVNEILDLNGMTVKRQNEAKKD